MWADPIVDEVRREREAHAERLGFDIAAICRELQQLQEQERGGRAVLLPDMPRRQRPSAA